MELATAGIVVGEWTSSLFQNRRAFGVVDGKSAVSSLARDANFGNNLDLLSHIVDCQGKVLPVVVLVVGNVPEQFVVAVEELPGSLVRAVRSNPRASVEVELVGAKVGRLVPDHEVLVAQVQRLRRLQLDAPVERHDARISSIVGRVFRKLQAVAAEANLVLEDGAVVNRALDRLVKRNIKLGWRALGKLEDL